MPVSLDTSAARSDLVRIVGDIFQTMLGVEVSEGNGYEPGPGAPTVTACMHVAGVWTGAIVLQCSLPAACEYAAVMLGIDRPSEPDSNVKDAVGELLNMVAGNFKSAMGAGSYLSLLTVVEGTDYRLHILRGTLAAQIPFQSAAGPFCVSLLEIDTAEK